MDNSEWCTLLLGHASRLRNQKEGTIFHDLATYKSDADAAESLAFAAQENRVTLPSSHHIVTLINDYIKGKTDDEVVAYMDISEFIDEYVPKIKKTPKIKTASTTQSSSSLKPAAIPSKAASETTIIEGSTMSEVSTSETTSDPLQAKKPISNNFANEDTDSVVLTSENTATSEAST